MSTRLPIVSSLVLAAALAAPHVAAAQPQATHERHGLFGGGALWGGNISCDGDNCGGFRKAGGASGHIGYMFSPRLGVLVDAWIMGSSENNVDITYVTGTVDLRYWLAPIIWVEGGVGNGHAIVSGFGLSARGDDVPVGELAAGLEVARARTWALDVQAKIAQGTSTDSSGGSVATGRMVGVGVGITWFGGR
jgi:hypothetical protein